MPPIESPLSQRPQDSVGMKRGSKTTVAAYNDLWPVEFARVRNELKAHVGGRVLAIDHVGSTSVPGLDAKPIIDISIAVANLAESLSLVPILEELGFQYRRNDALPDRHYLPRTVGGLRRHHLSLGEPGSWQRRNTLTFRNALRRDADLARRYATLKHQLAASSGVDRLAYLNGKTEFILAVLKAEGLEPDPAYPVHYIQSSRNPKSPR